MKRAVPFAVLVLALAGCGTTSQSSSVDNFSDPDEKAVAGTQVSGLRADQLVAAQGTPDQLVAERRAPVVAAHRHHPPPVAPTVRRQR